MQFQIEWLYSDIKRGQTPPDAQHFEVHFSFLIRFPDIPPGEDHVAHFCFNVISPSVAKELGIPTSKRCYVITEVFSYTSVIEEVENAVHDALQNHHREQALQLLNKRYVYTDRDFSDEFKPDVLEAQTIIEMIEQAFDGVSRGEGITLHEAVAMDDYKSANECRQARTLDREQRWQDVPAADIENNPSYLSFLDIDGYRYYLPASMCWVLNPGNNDLWNHTHSIYWSLGPQVGPRDKGKGLGEKINVEQFIEQCAFSQKQVKALYRFLCFVAVVKQYGVDEDEYPVMLKWRRAAGS